MISGIACNGIELFPSVNPSKSPSMYVLEGCQGSVASCESSGWTTVVYGENVEYGYESSHVASTPFTQSAFKTIRFTAQGIISSFLPSRNPGQPAVGL